MRLGCTKINIKGVRRRRCFLCICASGAAADGLCPACALSRLLAGASGGSGANAGKLVRGPAGHEVSHQGLCRAWRAMLAAVPRFDDAGKSVDAEVTEHTARRTGAQFHARWGLALWQIQYVGRWGGNTVEQYVAEAFAEIRADWVVDGSVQREAKRARSDERQEVRLWEISEELRRLSAAVEDVTGLRAELLKYKTGGGTFPNALCDETMERDLVDEALSEGTFEISAEKITRLRHRRSRMTWTAWRLRHVGGHRRAVGGLGGQRRVDGNLGQRTLVCRRAVLLVRGAANQRVPRSSWILVWWRSTTRIPTTRRRSEGAGSGSPCWEATSRKVLAGRCLVRSRGWRRGPGVVVCEVLWGSGCPGRGLRRGLRAPDLPAGQ